MAKYIRAGSDRLGEAAVTCARAGRSERSNRLNTTQAESPRLHLAQLHRDRSTCIFSRAADTPRGQTWYCSFETDAAHLLGHALVEQMVKVGFNQF